MKSESSPFTPRFERGNCGMGFVADIHGRASHEIVMAGLEGLENLEHRGALSADSSTGDGAGILTPIPTTFFSKTAQALSGRTPDRLGVGMFFFRPGTEPECRRQLEEAAHYNGLTVLAWRPVPVAPEALGERARKMMPVIEQALLTPTGSLSAEAFEHALYLARKRFERAATPSGAYVPSMSSRTIVYKGLLNAPQIAAFYQDLRDEDFAVSQIVFHQRYSTNTLPTWERAQPFRVLAHNGEINTLQGNINWMKSREPMLNTSWASASDLRPVVDERGSDSAMLDNVIELLNFGGRDVHHAITLLVPPAWEAIPDLPEAVRDLYEYHTCLTEPWDGPAGLVFSDGVRVGAALDRNGLRPCRYTVTEDGLVVAGSETGILPIEETRVRVKGKLGPGQMVLVDTHMGAFYKDSRIKAELAMRKPYGLWVREHIRRLPTNLPRTDIRPAPAEPLITRQAAFGYTGEELVMVLRPMVDDGVEPIGSMGDDTPAAILSDKPRPLFSYFRQRFAEVTNPPIDSLREKVVMSLKTQLGARRNLLAETPGQADLLELSSPILGLAELTAIRQDPALHAATISTLFSAAEGLAGFRAALDRIRSEAETAVRNGAEVVVLSDVGVNAEHAFVPSLLALGATHNHLLRLDLRTRVDFIIETGEAREVHHFACLIGYGAAAIHPYLAIETAVELGRTLSRETAITNYLHAAEYGLLKIMSKMGISTVDAYSGAQIFEAVGIDGDVIDAYFTGTAAHISGLSVEGIGKIALAWHAAGFGGEKATLDSRGYYKFKREGELHAWNPDVVRALHLAVRTEDALDGNWANGYASYKRYAELVHQRPPVDPRDLLDFATPVKPVDGPVADETWQQRADRLRDIVRRFSTAAMSHGSLSREAHESMSVAMNRLGALSNSGEGGESPDRYPTLGNDAIKQVASARFGVTTSYLVNAQELQIKMAQGAKPGEGGQLPGHKVSVEIATVRHATPGFTLISPPPHHDIYSIEDLAQLIYDLKQVNPRAVVSVKLVAQAGVGTIAAGVAKAGADVILISGHAGGTGASPLSSIKYTGAPWELGLAETQHMLVASGLRGRVRVRVDGGLRTGRDVVMAALLGADEFSFGTSAVIAEGCKMARACHLNTCPVGIATQKLELRAKFDGKPEHLIAFMLYIAQETQEILNGLGFATIEEAIGQVSRLRQAIFENANGETLDLSRIISAPAAGPRRYAGEPNPVSTQSALNAQLVADWELLGNARHGQFFYTITNRDRTFGARLAGAIARQFGDAGLHANTDLAGGNGKGGEVLDIRLRGNAGQSFGAWGVPGMHLTLAGAANDYVGKGLTGGRIVIHAPREAEYDFLPFLAGNTVLYGATGGEIFIAGRVGERFAVRNSGADAVVEGVGDHGCEYMTGGTVVILGAIGHNFGAGMTGGTAYVLDDGWARKRINLDLVEVQIPSKDDFVELRARVQRHAELTGSETAAALVAHWGTGAGRFLKILPKAVAAAQREAEARAEGSEVTVNVTPSRAA